MATWPFFAGSSIRCTMGAPFNWHVAEPVIHGRPDGLPCSSDIAQQSASRNRALFNLNEWAGEDRELVLARRKIQAQPVCSRFPDEAGIGHRRRLGGGSRILEVSKVEH